MYTIEAVADPGRGGTTISENNCHKKDGHQNAVLYISYFLSLTSPKILDLLHLLKDFSKDSGSARSTERDDEQYPIMLRFKRYYINYEKVSTAEIFQ